jgi:hypothetical protein
MSTHDETVARVREALESLPGVVRAAALDAERRDEALDLEERYERDAAIPVRNVGMRLLRERAQCVVLLKDARFRPPRIPTVFMVEEGAAAGAPHVLVIEGARYAIVGEEVVEGGAPYREPTIPLDASFVIFPERRSGPQVPCSFILPPVAFPELEERAAALGIGRIISISPSLAADACLRDALGFPPTNALATLCIGFDFLR